MRLATIGCLLLACSGPHAGAPQDASPGDGLATAVDAPTIPVDAITTPVTINVYADDGTDTPVNGALVFSHDQGGGFFTRTTTASDGTASIDVPIAGSVSVLRSRVGTIPGWNISTIYDIDAPMHLNFGWKPVTGGLLGTMRVFAPAYPGASSTYVLDGCESQPVMGDGYAIVHIFTNCQRTSYDFVAIAYGADGSPLASAELDSQPFVDGGTITIPATFATAQTFTASLSQIPGDDSFRVLRRELRAGLPYSMPVGAYVPPMSTSFNTTVPIAAATTSMELRVETSDYPRLLRDRVTTADSYTRSLADLLPWPAITSDAGGIQWTPIPFQTPFTDDGTYVLLDLFQPPYFNRWVLVGNGAHGFFVTPHFPSDIWLVVSGPARVALYDSERFSDYPSFAQDADREHMIRFSDADPSLHLRTSNALWP